VLLLLLPPLALLLPLLLVWFVWLLLLLLTWQTVADSQTCWQLLHLQSAAQWLLRQV
jgi:hypothetical protein